MYELFTLVISGWRTFKSGLKEKMTEISGHRTGRTGFLVAHPQDESMFPIEIL